MSFKEFDWVTARSECSIVKVFEILKMEIEKDVEALKRLMGENSLHKFGMLKANGAIAVTREIIGFPSSPTVIKFTRRDQAIAVEKNDHLMFTAGLTLNKDGECRLKIDSGEYELWEMRKMALEELFFEATKSR